MNYTNARSVKDRTRGAVSSSPQGCLSHAPCAGPGPAHAADLGYAHVIPTPDWLCLLDPCQVQILPADQPSMLDPVHGALLVWAPRAARAPDQPHMSHGRLGLAHAACSVWGWHRHTRGCSRAHAARGACLWAQSSPRPVIRPLELHDF